MSFWSSLSQVLATFCSLVMQVLLLTHKQVVMHKQRNEVSHCILCCRAWGAECTKATSLALYQHSSIIPNGQICSMASQLRLCVQRNSKFTFRSHANILWLAQVQNVRSSCANISASVVYQCSAKVQLYSVVQKLSAIVQCYSAVP